MKIIKKNKTKSDCGVVAAFNAASWSNIDKSYREVKKIAKSCGYNENIGIYSFQFSNLMKKLGIPAKKIRPKSLEEIEEKLHLGKFLIFLYRPAGYDTGHAVSAFSDHEGRVRLINPSYEWITWDDLAADANAGGMVTFNVYEIPHRKLISVKKK